ncbi:hypothetical protein CPB83DRAFT_840007 [Crepidotus variabilis]|uniref:Uncharacterized protein n=1 Tax=Crepidotus variabilis TaxID=179855 RepID=A0A9P6JJI4_9AGAR|nr:hypothetical protein CPB83DRAFT_840007 [Crepidotus variabilis]
MDIDVDWCLTCQRHIEGPTPYCSFECQDHAEPSSSRPKPQVFCTCDEDEDDDFSSLDDDDVIYHEIEAPTGSGSARWLGNDDAGIAAWAAEIQPGTPAELSTSPCCYHSPRKSISPKTYRPPPNLLKSSHRIVPPSLCTTAPQPESALTSTPILTPSRQSSINLLAQTTSQQASLGKASSKSAQTDSSLSTPASSHPVPIHLAGRKASAFDDMYTQVRSWVSPCPSIFVPAEVMQKRYQPPIQRVNSSKNLFTTHEFVQKYSRTDSSRGRSRLASELAYQNEQLSFKARGRKSSRVAA